MSGDKALSYIVALNEQEGTEMKLECWSSWTRLRLTLFLRKTLIPKILAWVTMKLAHWEKEFITRWRFKG